MTAKHKERRKNKTAPPRDIEQTYRSLVSNIKDYAIFMMDRKGCITSWDQGCTKLFGYRKSEIIGQKFGVLFTPADNKRDIPAADMAVAMDEGRHLDEREYMRKNKTVFRSNGVLTANRNKKGVHQGFSKIMRDVTKQSELHKTAVHNSMHDFLTGLPNRNFFEETIVESIDKAKKGGGMLAVYYMDFNNFKRTNDEQGHEFGDLVLIEIAHRLSHNIRLSDLAARFGGDEFVILAKGFRTRTAVGNFADKILKSFRVPIRIKKRVIHTSVSIGVAIYPNDGTRPSELLRFSDMALYQAKKSGGNGYKFYSEDLFRKPMPPLPDKNLKAAS